MDSLRILIADDESLRVLSLKGQLESLGHKVIGEASNGKEALHLADELKPDLAILDIKMPEMDGIEAAEKMMETRPIPIILLPGIGPGREAEVVAGIASHGERRWPSPTTRPIPPT